MNIKKMENKVKVWLARDKDGDLFVYSSAPFKKECIWSPQSTNIHSMELKSDKFPSVKWEDDEPTEAYITLAEPQEQPKKEIDWEQRRYEIAKNLYEQYKDMDEIGAVHAANKLINELKKQNK